MTDQPAAEPTSTEAPQDAGPSDSADVPRGTKPKKPARRSKPKAAPAAATARVVLRWLGDESRFTNGVPNRDVTSDDLHVDEELAELAVESGTHERV